MALVYVLLVVNALMEGLASIGFLGLIPPMDDNMRKVDAAIKSCTRGSAECNDYTELLSGICSAATLSLAVGSIAAFVGPRPVPKSILVLFATYHVVVAYFIASYAPDVSEITHAYNSAWKFNGAF
eukprot:m.588553 g.588553  ORF g.588553 m.588553 type:complete len:126 (-) comp22365_c0_seq12:269-646(-)